MPDEPKQPSESISREQVSDPNQNELSQREIVELLQKTIGQLEVIVNKLNTESLSILPPRVVVETLTSNTEVLAELLGQTSTETANKPVQPTDVSFNNDFISEKQAETIFFNEEEIDLEEPTEPVRVEQVSPSSESGWWNGILGTIRSLLPAALSDRLPNWGIIGILSTVVIAAVVTSVVFVSRPSPEIAQNPTLTPAPSPSLTPSPIPSQTPTPTPETLLPPEIEAPGNPQPVEFAPPPEPELTPEQSLIASIQEEVSDLTSQYPEGLIATIEANFLGSRLIVTMGDEWYSLGSSRQNNLANAIFERSRRLDFRKLELLDSEGIVIARSPVVGEEMVILQRQKELQPTS